MFTDPRTLFPSDRLGAIQSIQPLTLGMSGAQVHAVTTTSGEYVIRVQATDAPGFARALPFLRLAAQHGVAPRLVHVNEAARCTVSEKVSGTLFARALAAPETRAAAMGSLVKQLATLHAIPTEGLARAKDPTWSARAVWDEQSRRPGFPAWASPLGQRLDDAEAALAEDPRKAFCHCDLNPANMMWDGTRLWIVDWDMAGLEHPYLDLASFSNFLMLSDDDATALLAAEERAPLSAAQKRTFLCLRDFARVVYGCVFLRLVPDLEAVDMPSLGEAPTLAACYAGMQAGTMDAKSPAGAALMGCALFGQVRRDA